MKRYIVLVVVLTLVCGALAQAQSRVGAGRPGTTGQRPPGGMMGFGMGMCAAMAIAPPGAALMDRLTTELELTDDQSVRLKAVLEDSDKKLATLREKAADANRALRQAVFAERFDSAKIQSLAAEAQKAEAAILNAEIQTWIQIRGILNSKQVSMLQDLLTRPFGRPMPGGPPGAGGPPGSPQGPMPPGPPPPPGQ